MRRNWLLAILVVVGLLGAVPASAVTIDFTDENPWDGVDGVAAFADGDITITSVGGLMTFNAGDNGGCLAGQGGLHGLACDGDGIGIGNDEVTGNTPQQLMVDFSSLPLAVNILGVEVLDLFQDEGPDGDDEVVELSTDGINWFSFPSAGGTGGYMLITLADMQAAGFSPSNATALYLQGLDDAVSDVALAGIEYEPVPEPGTLALLGIGLAGLRLRACRRTRR